MCRFFLCYLFFHPVFQFLYTLPRIYPNACNKDRSSESSIRWLLILFPGGIFSNSHCTHCCVVSPTQFNHFYLSSSQLIIVSYSLQSCVSQINCSILKYLPYLGGIYYSFIPFWNSLALNVYGHLTEDSLPCIGGHLFI